MSEVWVWVVLNEDWFARKYLEKHISVIMVLYYTALDFV